MVSHADLGGLFQRGHRLGRRAKDVGVPANDFRPQFVAASLTAAFNVLSERADGPSAKRKTARDVAAQIDPVITFLRSGLDALKEPRRR